MRPKNWKALGAAWLIAAVYVSGGMLISGTFVSTAWLAAARTRVKIEPTAKPALSQTTPTPTTSASAAISTSTKPPAAPPAGVRANPFAGEKLFIDPDSPAAQQASAWATTRPSDAALMRKIATQPVATWLGDWYGNVGQATRDWLNQMKAANSLPVFVLYNIPNRDCGSYSAGGASSADAYRNWVKAIADASSGRKAVFILEPDALAGWDCLSAAQRSERASLLRYAVETLGAPTNHYVYLDAGNARWQSPETIAGRVREIGTAKLQGVALNVSNFLTTAESKSYGQRLSSLTGGLHVVIDTSRNGQGPMPDLSWCNPPNRGLGAPPSAQGGTIDALLWIKYPGESDGACNGGPESGEWWPDYALGLAQRAAF